MFEALNLINQRPKPYESCTLSQLWNDPHVSKRMLEYHLDEKVDLASRNKDFIASSVAWMTSRFNIGSGSRICDFGCGPGLYAMPLAQKGADVTGVDLSERSLAYARKAAAAKRLDIDYQFQDYLQFSTKKKFDLIMMIYFDFCALSPSQRKELLGMFYQYLEKDGSVLLDVLSMKYFNRIKEKISYEYSPEGGFWSPEPYYVFLNTFKYKKEKLLLDKYTIFEKTRTREIYNWLQCFSLQSLKQEFRENGFLVTKHYLNVSGTPFKPGSKEITVIATRAN